MMIVSYGARIFHMALVFFIWRSYFSYGARIFHMALVQRAVSRWTSFKTVASRILQKKSTPFQ
ncbi:hypothetical protein P8610_16055 [Fictibacillus sp. UD]